MTERLEVDLPALRRTWADRRARAQTVMARIDPRGMTCPARTPYEREWLKARGGTSFVEGERAGALARAYFERRYGTTHGDG